VIDEVVHVWLPTQRQLAHPAMDLMLEVRRKCELVGLQPPSRTTIGRRWAQHREADALKRAAPPDAMTAPGSLVAKYPLEIVQVDHTQADVVLDSEYDRRVIGRPWLTIALDVATKMRVEFLRRHGASGSGHRWFAADQSSTVKSPLARKDRGRRRMADAWNSAGSPSRQCCRV
jgi:putative transposase